MLPLKLTITINEFLSVSLLTKEKTFMNSEIFLQPVSLMYQHIGKSNIYLINKLSIKSKYNWMKYKYVIDNNTVSD